MNSFIIVAVVSILTGIQSIRVPIYQSFEPSSHYGLSRGLPVHHPVAAASYIWLPFSTNPPPKYQIEPTKTTIKKSKAPKKYQPTEEPEKISEPLPDFLAKIYENDPFRRNGKHYLPESGSLEEAEAHQVPQDSIPPSEHEFPLEIPTRPIYPGEGQWARPGSKHRLVIRPSPQATLEESNVEEPPSDGYETFENGEAKFNEARSKFDSKSEDLEDPSEQDSTKYSLTQPIGFIPRKTYAQIRHSEETHHLPQSEAIKAASTQEELINAPRLREVIKNTKSRVVYTEEGYEDSAYDHAGHVKKAEDHQDFNLHEDDLHKDKKTHKKFVKDSDGEESVKKYGSNDERRYLHNNQERVNEEHEDQVERHQGERQHRAKSSKYRKTKPKKSKKNKIHAEASEKNIKIEKPINGWIETNIAKDLEETIYTNSEEGNVDWNKLANDTNQRQNINMTNENLEILTSEPFNLEKVDSETATPVIRVKRYDREKLSKIYTRKRPVYYWEKNKNKTVPSTISPPAKTSLEKPTFTNPPRKNLRNLRLKRTPLDLDDIDDLTYKIEDVRKIPLPKPNPDLDHLKYPYYLKPETPLLNRHSPLRYAENLRNIPPKTDGGLEFYESRSYIQCPEVEPNLDPIPDHIKNQNEDSEDTEEDQEKMVPLNKPPVQRLKGLGDKIDCLKVKYFGTNPLDSPFFKETEIPAPSLEEVFKKQPITFDSKLDPSTYIQQKVKHLNFISKYPNHRPKRNAKESTVKIIVVEETEPTSTTESNTEKIEYLTLPPPTSSTEKMTEMKTSKKPKKKIRIKRPTSSTTTTTTTTVSSIATTTLDYRDVEKRRAIEINELVGPGTLENIETTSVLPSEPPVKVSKRRSKILHLPTTEKISTTTNKVSITENPTTEPPIPSVDQDVVLFVDTQGDHLLDIPLQLPLVGNSTFGETFDINQYYPKINISFEQPEHVNNPENKDSTKHQDQMNVFSDVLQHFQGESEVKDKRAVKAPRRKQRMRISPNQDNANSENKQVESFASPPDNSQSTFLRHEDLTTKAVYEPEKGFDNIPEFSNNPDHPNSYDIKEDQREEIRPEEEISGDPNDSSYFPLRDSENPQRYDLIYNHILNSYTLRPNSAKEEVPKTNAYYSYRNVNTKDEETIVHGLQPVRYESGIKFIIPQKMIPQPHAEQFRAVVRPSTSASSPQIRFLIKPKITKTIHLPPIEMMQSLADNLAARHRVRSADFVNIPGMYPPPMGQSIRINYNSYYPPTFDFLRASGSHLDESVVDLNGNPVKNVAQNRKYTELNQSNRQANFFRTPEETPEVTTGRNLIVLAAISRERHEETKFNVSEIQPNNSRLIASTVIPYINSSGLLLRDSYGSVLAKPSLQAFSSVVEENRNHSARIMNESHEPVTYINATYPEKSLQGPSNTTVIPKRSFSNFNRRRRPVTTTQKPSTTTDQRRGEPRYSDIPVRSKYSSRTRKEFNTSAISNPELAIFQMVQTPEVFDINSYLPRTNILSGSLSENSSVKPPEAKTRYPFSSRFKADEKKLPLPPEETLQTPFIVSKSVNLTQTGSEIQPRIIHLSRRHEEKPPTTTMASIYKIRRRHPISSAAKNKTETTTVRSRIKKNQEVVGNRTRTRSSSRHRVPVDAVALLQKSRNSNSKKLRHEEPSSIETKSAMSKVVIITPSPSEDVPMENVEIFGDSDQVKSGPKHGGNYRSINEENETKTKKNSKDTHKDHHRYIEDDPEETLGLENSDLVEIIGNYDAIRNGPKHGGNYRHINDQKYENSNHNSGTNQDDDYSEVDPRSYRSNFDYDRSFAESKHEEDATSTPSTEPNQYDSKPFYTDYSLPHKVNNLKTGTPEEFDVDVDYEDHENQETQQQRPAFWSKIVKNPGVREYFYSRT